MDRDDYWQEAFEMAFEEAVGTDALKALTKEQCAEIGGALAMSAECEGQAFPSPPSYATSEADRLKRQLKWTQELEQCSICKGSGREVSYGGTLRFDMTCPGCSGQGKVHPHGEREPTP